MEQIDVALGIKAKGDLRDKGKANEYRVFKGLLFIVRAASTQHVQSSRPVYGAARRALDALNVLYPKS
jgi:hypothetical protein